MFNCLCESKSCFRYTVINDTFAVTVKKRGLTHDDQVEHGFLSHPELFGDVSSQGHLPKKQETTSKSKANSKAQILCISMNTDRSAAATKSVSLLNSELRVRFY